MTLHHRAALDMARAYHANPDARNRFLGLMNVGIITDQSQEIALMRSVVASYPGDPDAVRVDASMIHRMEGMQHGGGGHAGHGGAAAEAPDPAAQSPSPVHRPRPAPRAQAAPQGSGRRDGL